MVTKKGDLELRMYSLVMYNISPIQQGIQSGHANVRYGRKYPDGLYGEWADHWETVIVLNGGTSKTMMDHLNTLILNDVDCVPFYETDLNDSPSAISFLVDERVFDKEKYPEPTNTKKIKDIFSSLGEFYRLTQDYNNLAYAISSAARIQEVIAEETEEFNKVLSTHQNIFLRQWLKPFRLA
jgi:hypothetical protein